MTFPFPRLPQCALVLLALSGAPTLFAQSSLGAPVESATTFTALPDAPSFSTSQQKAPETDEQRKAREREEAEREVKAQEKQRIGGVMPDFNVVLNGKAVALTPKQKFDLAFHTIIDPYTIGLAAVIGGGYGELTDDHTGYSHGPSGFFKRVAASYGDTAIGTLVGNAILPVLLKDDPRYFRKGEGSIKSRMVYSALTTFITHTDKGDKRRFNISNVLGNFIAGAISNAYYPDDERGVGLTISNAVVVTLEGMLGAQLLEFSPDITDKIHRHRQRIRDQKAAAAAALLPPQPDAPPNVVQPAAPPPLPPQR